MNIKDAAERTGLPAKTIRYYEDIGLISPKRSENGYRSFADSDLHKLAFLARARGLGFSIEECRTLLGLYQDQSRASSDVKLLAEAHLNRVHEKIEELRAMAATLSDLVNACAGDSRPDCPILHGIETGKPCAHGTGQP